MLSVHTAKTGADPNGQLAGLRKSPPGCAAALKASASVRSVMTESVAGTFSVPIKWHVDGTGLFFRFIVFV
jgi:hypothetical protein